MAQGKHTIVVVDDDPAIRGVMKHFLENEDFRVKTSADGDLVYSMKRNFPDLFLLDIALGEEDGCDICRFLKSKQGTQRIPVIILSADRNGVKLAKKAGADAFFAKPFDMDEVLLKIKTMIYNKAP